MLSTVRHWITLEKTSSRVRRIGETYAGAVFVALLAGLFIAAIFQDVRLRLWNDELLTLYVSEQPTIADVFSSIREGIDSQPPLYDLIVRGLHHVIHSDGLSVRLPSTVGFFVMAMCVYAFVRKRLPAIYAVLAALAAVRTTWQFAFEGRSYGLVLGCVGLTLVCWQAVSRTPTARALAGLSISLAAAIAFHYFAACVTCALFVAEIFRWRKSRQLNFRMLSALVLPFIVLTLHLPFIRAGQPFVRYFWSKAEVVTLYRYYSLTISPLSPVLFLSGVCCLCFSLWRRSCPEDQLGRLDPPWVEEWVAALGLMLLPEVVILASLSTIKVFVDRYVVWSAIGVGVCLAVLLHKLVEGNRIVAAVVLLPLLVWSTATTVEYAIAPATFHYDASLSQQVQRIPAGQTPIVITRVHTFMELWFYSQPDLRNRLVYLVNADLERRYTHADTTSLVLSALRRRVPVGAVDYDAFIESNPRFVVAGDAGDWIVSHLRNLNYRFVPSRDESGGTQDMVYEVYSPLISSK